LPPGPPGIESVLVSAVVGAGTLDELELTVVVTLADDEPRGPGALDSLHAAMTTSDARAKILEAE
jgi:hypothetical protein